MSSLVSENFEISGLGNAISDNIRRTFQEIKKCKIQDQVIALQMPFTYNKKSLKIPHNFSSTHVRICVKDASPLVSAAGAKRGKILIAWQGNRRLKLKTAPLGKKGNVSSIKAHVYIESKVDSIYHYWCFLVCSLLSTFG